MSSLLYVWLERRVSNGWFSVNAPVSKAHKLVHSANLHTHKHTVVVHIHVLDARCLLLDRGWTAMDILPLAFMLRLTTARI